jgi:hypothetical protein
VIRPYPIAPDYLIWSCKGLGGLGAVMIAVLICIAVGELM